MTLRGVSWRAALPLAAALFLGLGSVRLFSLIARPLALLVIAVTLAEALEPIVQRLTGLVRKRGLAIGLVYLCLAAIGIGLGYLVVPTVVTQAHTLVNQLPELLSSAEAWTSRLRLPFGLNLADLASSLSSRVGRLAVAIPVTVFQALLDMFIVLFLSIYWLYGKAEIERFTLSLFARRHRAKTRHVLHDMGQSMGGYVRGAVINAVIMGGLAWLGLTLIDMPFALVLGVLTMFGELVPIIGPILVGIIVALLALTQSLTQAVVALALFTALEQFEGHILTPNIMHRQTQVPQTLVLFAIVVGALGGILGILVAIPLAAALRLLVLQVLAPAERQLVREGDGQ